MPKLNYNFNSLYITLAILLYALLNTSNNEWINIFLNKIYLMDYMSCIIVLNAIGLYIFLKNLNFEITIQWLIKYK